jgi:hypothetical protein
VRRRKLLVALAVGLAGLVAAVTLRLRSPRGENITMDNWFRIKPLMTRAELEALLGPPGDYRTGPAGPYAGTGWSVARADGSKPTNLSPPPCIGPPISCKSGSSLPRTTRSIRANSPSWCRST